MDAVITRIPPGAVRDPHQVETRHPCLNAEAHRSAGRLHLPVAPACNIVCSFCTRKVGGSDACPGQTARLVHPSEAAETVARALELVPELTVVGVAGPGDALATGHALEAFRSIRDAFPDLVLCLSTNGLRLPDRIEELDEAGIGTLTVTVNAVDPAILARIVDGIAQPGGWVTGEDGARILIDAQLTGIREAAERGILVKANLVLVPGVNDDHIGEVARRVAAAGATRINIVPLIPSNGMADRPAPTCVQVEDARAQAHPHLEVFRHCRQCRADALGVPDREDLGGQLYGDGMATFSHG